MGDRRYITFKGLKVHLRLPKSDHTTKFEISESESLTHLCGVFEREGYERPLYITCDGRRLNVNSQKSVIQPYNLVRVVQSQPSNDREIGIHETFTEYANRCYAKNEFCITEDRTDVRTLQRPVKTIQDEQGLDIAFHRTTRLPDDNKLHHLPQSLGCYDLFNVAEYAGRLPQNIRDAGGVFFPMFQREAMWISFSLRTDYPEARYAVRVFVGRVNAVSGQLMDEEPTQDGGERKQDYIVIPGQKWLDGICVAPGVVRQFVAMPLGSGYTIEGQKTSEEKFGGLQIEIIPKLRVGLRSFYRNDDSHICRDGDFTTYLDEAKRIGEYMTPLEAGLTTGDYVRSYPRNAISQVPVLVKDLVGETTGEATCMVEYPRSTPAPPFGFCKGGPSSDSDDMSMARTFRSIPRPASAEFSSMWLPSSASKIVLDKPPVHPLPSVAHAPPLAYGPPLAQLQVEQHDDDKFNARVAPDTILREDKDPVDTMTGEFKAMGLAAGGKLVQDIYKDPFTHETWNHAAARVINVHILDPATCERVTHIVPAPPPIDAKSYAKGGGKFYVVEEQVDNRVDGGDFEGLKSVSEMDEHVGVQGEQEEFDPRKSRSCPSCVVRLCDCIVRPCNHQFCNSCIRDSLSPPSEAAIMHRMECPRCKKHIDHVAGFSSPMNIPGEESLRMKVPVTVLEIDDGRIRFKSVQTTRM